LKQSKPGSAAGRGMQVALALLEDIFRAMPMTKANLFLLAALGAVLATPAVAAGNFDNSVNYNNPIGMTSGQENATVNSSLRDANGNLTVVNGQITSSSFSEVNGAQTFNGGVGNPAGTRTGTATAIGNQLNVVTAGSNNIVIVSSTQTNNGSQTANTNLSGN
jgi:holdfast attachment protein HfaA